MTPLKVLLTGAGGQLGIDIAAAAAVEADIDLHPFTRQQLDVTNSAQVDDVITSVNPQVIIHAAAYTAVDDCESNRDHAMAVNGDGTANVVAAARQIDARVIYVSTDYVFDGTKPEPYTETDTPNPTSVYGISKLAGENAVRELGDNGLIVRTSWVCGAHGSNMVKTILNAAVAHPVLTFVDDQIGNPTFTTDLADTLVALARRNDAGIMHVTNTGTVSWYEFCQHVLTEMGRDPAQVQPCTTDELQPPRPAPRPANSVLANTRFNELGLQPLRPFIEPLTETVHDLTKPTE